MRVFAHGFFLCVSLHSNFFLCFSLMQVRWMMYWIVFALYTVAETIADLSVAW